MTENWHLIDPVSERDERMALGEGPRAGARARPGRPGRHRGRDGGAVSERYTVVNYVVEFRVAGGPWGTWAGTGNIADDDGRSAREEFLLAWKTRHDPARMRFRLVRRTSVITDEVMAEELPGGSIEMLQGDRAKTL